MRIVRTADPFPCPLFDPLCSTVKILKRLPRASCHPSSRKLAAILDQVTSNINESSWEHLFCFAPRCPRVPRRGGHCRSLASCVNSMTREEADSDLPQSAPGIMTSRVPQDALENLAARVSAKLEEGFRGAICLASFEDTIAEANRNSLSAL